jgi:1,5-anhydro-D-fructose reductase (1,5-anhydro-D-mannitol-forming)
MVRVAIAGLGFMGRTHLAVYRRLENVQVTAVCDRAAEAFEPGGQAAGNIDTGSGSLDLGGAQRFTDFASLLKAGGFDFVDLALPTPLHAEFAVRALEAGYHVFCEKPMALDGSSVDAMCAKVRETGRLFGIGLCLRFWPAYVEAKKLVDQGRYGRLRHLELNRYSSPPTWGRDNWYHKSELSGNAGLDLHIHDVDLMLWHAGLPRSVRSTGVKEKDGGFSHISTVYQYPGLSATTEGGWELSKTFGFRMRALYVLERATIELDSSRSPLLTVYPDDGEKWSPELPAEDGYFHELKAFVEAVRTGVPSRVVTPEAAALAVKVCIEEIRSARENREVETSSLR